VLGAVFVVFSLGSGSSTAAACPGVARTVSKVEFAGRGFASVLRWYDGCNWHALPFVPLALGAACLLGGTGLAAGTTAASE